MLRYGGGLERETINKYFLYDNKLILTIHFIFIYHTILGGKFRFE